MSEGAECGKKTYEETIAFADRRGFVFFAMANKSDLLRVLFDLGDWNQVHGLADELVIWSEARGENYLGVSALLSQAPVLLWRGLYSEAGDLQSRLLDFARRTEELQLLVPALAFSALMEQAREKIREAVSLIGELEEATRHHSPYRARHLPTVMRVLLSAGDVAGAEDFMKGMEVAALRDRNCLLTGRALVAEAKQEHDQAIELYDDAARRWADYGFVLEEGQAHLGLACCLIALGDHEAAKEPLRKASAIFSRLGAVPLFNEVDGYLGDMQVASG